MTFEKLIVLTWNFLTFPKILLALGIWHKHLPKEAPISIRKNGLSCLHIVSLTNLYYRVTEMFKI